MTPDRSGNARRLDKGGNALDLGTRSPVARLIVSFLGGVNPGVVTSGAAKSQCSDTEVYAPGTGDSPPLTAAPQRCGSLVSFPKVCPGVPSAPCIAWHQEFLSGVSSLRPDRETRSHHALPSSERRHSSPPCRPYVSLPTPTALANLLHADAKRSGTFLWLLSPDRLQPSRCPCRLLPWTGVGQARKRIRRAI